MNIVILSCENFPQATESEQLIAKAIERQGPQICILPWNEVKASDPYDLFLFRTVWDYIERWDEFESWFQTLEKAKVNSVNSLESIRWNLNKKYMLELADSGIEIPKSFVHQRQWLPNWDTLEEKLGPPPFVFKPLVSSGGTNTFLVQGDVSYSAAIDQLQGQHFIAQNYLKEIKDGEISAMVFGGQYSHAVLKRPQGQEFRVQSNHGGTVELFDLSEDLRIWTEMVVTKAPGAPIIARVDFVMVQDRPVLMELEVFEPELFLEFQPEAADQIANLMLTNNS